MFIKVTRPKNDDHLGRACYVNVDQIQWVQPHWRDPSRGLICLIGDEDAAVETEEAAETIIERLMGRGYQVVL